MDRKKGEFEGLIADRSKSQQEIDTQIDQLNGEFWKTECSEKIPALAREGSQYSEGLGDMLPGGWAEIWIAPIPKCWGGVG